MAYYIQNSWIGGMMSIFGRVKRVLGFEDSSEPAPVQAEHPRKSTPASSTYAARLEAERANKDTFFKQHPQSPIPPEKREDFAGLDYYPPNLQLRLELALEPADTVEQLTLQTTTDGEQVFDRIGYVSFDVDGEPAQLAVYRPADGGELFIPFRDATSGDETYGAGRYLEPKPLDTETLLVDFNTAYNPFCAYNEEYSCPLPPIENWLDVPIRAGEKAYSK